MYELLTFADRQRAAPLSVETTLSTGVATQDVTSVTGEVDDVVEVELAAISPSIYRVSRVTASDCWRRRAKSAENVLLRWHLKKMCGFCHITLQRAASFLFT